MDTAVLAVVLTIRDLEPINVNSPNRQFSTNKESIWVALEQSLKFQLCQIQLCMRNHLRFPPQNSSASVSNKEFLLFGLKINQYFGLQTKLSSDIYLPQSYQYFKSGFL